MLRGKQTVALETAGEREAGLGAVWDAEGLGCSLGGAQKPSDAFKKRSVKGCSGGLVWGWGWERPGGRPGLESRTSADENAGGLTRVRRGTGDSQQPRSRYGAQHRAGAAAWPWGARGGEEPACRARGPPGARGGHWLPPTGSGQSRGRGLSHSTGHMRHSD